MEGKVLPEPDPALITDSEITRPLQAATRTGVRTLSLWLTVTSPRAAILGSRDKHVSLGDSLTITCELRRMEKRPDYVFWYHNNTMINYHQHVSVVTNTLGRRM